MRTQYDTKLLVYCLINGQFVKHVLCEQHMRLNLGSWILDAEGKGWTIIGMAYPQGKDLDTYNYEKLLLNDK
jgi:hypothetical protein